MNDRSQIGMYQKRACQIEAIQVHLALFASLSIILEGWGITYDKPDSDELKVNLGGAAKVIHEGDYIIRDSTGAVTVCDKSRFDRMYVKSE